VAQRTHEGSGGNLELELEEVCTRGSCEGPQVTRAPHAEAGVLAVLAKFDLRSNMATYAE